MSVSGSSTRMWSAIAQPTILREYTSMIAAILRNLIRWERPRSGCWNVDDGGAWSPWVGLRSGGGSWNGDVDKTFKQGVKIGLAVVDLATPLRRDGRTRRDVITGRR